MNKARKTPTPEQKAWMKENNYTESQMDAFWTENIETNFKIRSFNANGMSWRDLNMYLVKQLPTLKECDAKALAEKKLEEQKKAEAAAQEKKDADYYNAHFEELMVKKIGAKETLTEKELRRLRDYEIECTFGENRRWTRSAHSILSLCDRFFSLDWEEGLTESQENEYMDQPYEVEKHTYEKTITVTEWVTKNTSTKASSTPVPAVPPCIPD